MAHIIVMRRQTCLSAADGADDSMPPAANKRLMLNKADRTGYLGILICKLVLNDLVEFVLDKNLLVLDVVASQSCVGDDAAFDELLETDQLTELALEVELVALVCYQINVALAFVNDCKKFINVYIAK